ncbi:DUF2207 domain-containing protein [Luteococcus sp. Sow4_B9]|uniref:DUF2207 domain-containing protein n=1 Tax=Luteococcus sp. Sow4_B9 TaxID=3438792 RepID=UPI003F99284D
MDPVRPRYTLLVRGMLASLLALLMGAMAALPARGDETSSQWQITRHETTAELGTNGDARVTTTIDFDFGRDAGHGPYLTFVTRQAIAGDRDHWRRITYDDVRITSPTGAPTNLKRSSEPGVLTLRIGREGTRVRGVQTYVVSYRLRGIVDPENAESGLDEVNWNVIGDGFTVPIRNASTTLVMPTDVTRTACWIDRTQTCQRVTQDGRTVTYRHNNLASGEPMQVVAGVPTGSFVGAEPEVVTRFNPARAFEPNPANAGIAGSVLLAGLLMVVRAARRHGRDEVYVGLTPGLTPTASDAGATRRTSRKAPVTVQFTPPAGVRPGEIGTLVDERADTRDVTATLIDLAVRGQIQIEQLGKKEWAFTRTRPAHPDELLPHETKLLQHLFSRGSRVTTRDLKDKRYAKLFPEARSALYKQVTGGRHWFGSSPQTTRTMWLGVGLAIVLLGFFGFLGGMFLLNLAWPGLALVVVGLALAIVSPWMPARTADGSAALAQARGFELYLRTAEAEQLKFEEGEDIFSRYLPWAIMFGVAERWSKLFEKLAAEGRYDMAPAWYVGNPYYGFNYGYIGSSMSSMGDAFSSAMQSSQAAAAASSMQSSGGGSGFSGGGGGFGGGGGGGW